MIIAGLKFRALKAPIMYNTAGVYVYKHKASGKCFVRAMKNCRAQRSKNNYPTHLKSYLKQNPSDIIVYLTELKTERREALNLSLNAVATELSSRGLLFKQEEARVGIYKPLRGEETIHYTLWSMTHVHTGAVYYFYDKKGVCVNARVNQRIKTFNNYVEKNVVNANRAMHSFTKKHYPLSLEDWVVRDFDLTLISEREAKIELTKNSKRALENGVVVLNRVCDTDVLYYRNAILKMPHQSMDEYIGAK